MFLLLEWIRLLNTKIKDCLEQTRFTGMIWTLQNYTHEKMDIYDKSFWNEPECQLLYETELSIFFMISSA